MKIRILIALILVSLIIVSCSSTDHEKIGIVTVINVDPPYEVELSREVILPIILNGAILVMEECYEYYDSSLGEPELIDGYWEFYWCPEYPDWGITVERINGNVRIYEFG